jgi:hypothetical protein
MLYFEKYEERYFLVIWTIVNFEFVHYFFAPSDIEQ